MALVRSRFSILFLLTLISIPSWLGGCGASHDCGLALDGPLPAPELLHAPMYAPNQAAIKRLLDERAVTTPEPEYWLGLVPGTSEEWGHHRAPPREIEASGQLISAEFQSRLDRAYRLLADGATRFLLISGGAVDSQRPDYVEAERGRDYLLRTYQESWLGTEPLPSRILIDTQAMTTPENVRNADLLAVQLGLVRTLIITTMPRRSTLSVDSVGSQGFYLIEHEVSTFDSRCRSDLGYTLGAFELRAFEQVGGDSEQAIHHCQFNVSGLRSDPLWR